MPVNAKAGGRVDSALPRHFTQRTSVEWLFRLFCEVNDLEDTANRERMGNAAEDASSGSPIKRQLDREAFGYRGVKYTAFAQLKPGR